MKRRREHFRITKYARRYDRKTERFIINIEYETATEITPRTIGVAEAFGLGIDQHERFVVYDDVELKIGPKDIVYITGDSGSGKSVLLRAVKRDLCGEALDMTDIQVDPDKPLIDTVGKTLSEGLEFLSRAGLNDAFLFVRRYRELSDGQKYRYKIAKLMESGRQWWIADEFCSTLDRDTAKIVAFNMQKLARKSGKAVIVATTHTDLLQDLKPSVHIHKRFGKEIQVRYFPNKVNMECSLSREIRIEEGNRADYEVLAGFHYRSHRVGVARKIFKATRGEEVCGVIVYAYPPATCFGRRRVLPKMSIRELNQKLSLIMRVVVHPKYRTIGLGQRLIRETLPRAGTPFVEMIAVMAKYNPFAERAGMTRIAEQPPSREALKIAETLRQLGFNLTFLGSKKYVLNQLASLKPENLKEVRQAFKENIHLRFMKEFFSHKPYGKAKLFKERVDMADFGKLAKLIKIVGMLLQTKVYLFWRSL
ncbi:MAG: ABC transporter ATP-binding protein [Candidatus Bathyarchaeia archaeon]